MFIYIYSTIRIVAKKNPQLQSQRDDNREIDRIRVPVEQFFGRMQQLFTLLRNTYTLDHSHFDTDFDNCVFLTNEHIRANHPLAEGDRKFYHTVMQQRLEKYKKVREKRSKQNDQYRERKRARLQRKRMNLY